MEGPQITRTALFNESQKKILNHIIFTKIAIFVLCTKIYLFIFFFEFSYTIIHNTVNVHTWN